MNTKILQAGGTNSWLSENALHAFREHKNYLYFCLYFYALAYLFLAFTLNYAETGIFSNFFLFLMNSAVLGATVIGIYVAKLLIVERPKESPIKHSYHALRRDIFSHDNIWRILFSVIGLSLVISAFLVVKGLIPKIVPFSYDIAFEELDRALHFGYQPWELLQPLLGYEWVTLSIHRLYYLWFPVIYVTFSGRWGHVLIRN